MVVHRKLWSIDQLRTHAAVVKGEVQPTKVLLNGTYLNSYLKRWEQANIWIYQDRIVYVGSRVPLDLEGIEVIDCEGYYLVPGYIEPHVHPFQLYHPETLSAYAAKHGTTTLICDNQVFYQSFSDEKSFEIINQLDKLPVSLYWWCRYDLQTELLEDQISDGRVRNWINHPSVIQGGELTSWPQVLYGDNQILQWMQETKQLGKPVEGHLPGASEKTLTQMKLLGVDCDHEAMTGEEAIRRLRLGYTTSLRYSSIRPDLPVILKEMIEEGITNFDHAYMNTDGMTPAFYDEGVMDRCVEIALEQGVPEIDAYMMASSNVSNHYNMDDILGHIAPGRVAHINILASPKSPNPDGVIAKGEWVKKNNDPCYPFEAQFSLKEAFEPLEINWDLQESMLEATETIGLEMINAVITKPFELENLPKENELPDGVSYLTLIDRHGQWVMNTFVKGFADNVSGLASSFSSTGDFILIGRSKSDMIKAFQKMKQIKGGFVLVENGKEIMSMELSVGGKMSSKPMETLIEEQKQFMTELRSRGYKFEDPIYSFLFFSSTHLPYIRVTQLGMFDVMRRKVIVPSKPLN
ncbi:adenine deaminase C-terminal domain-containing protein [Scopulibacillus cellulosilyticus]|uniref:adenine deaminase n=1 Tax=Scopulibacillus cellulosilyticus TaxID=2665665 RepID=A0ABW2Q1I3_9BACL